jgi:hypothetical protein
VHSKVLLLAIAISPLTPATVSHRSAHFVVEAPSAEMADRVARAAERLLTDLSRQWLGRELPEWSEPCPIIVTLGSEASRGSTSFIFVDGRISWQEMRLEGSLDRILGGVLPHEMGHVVLTQHFRRPFPRWADEGGATLGEGEVERARYREQMRQLLTTPERCIPLRDLFTLNRYPRDAFAFYQAGSSVSSYLVALGGRRKFLEFLAVAMDGDWDAAVRRFYDFDTVEDLERSWLERVRREGPPVRTAAEKTEMLAAPAAVRR